MSGHQNQSHLREAGSMDGTPSEDSGALPVSMGDDSPNACRAVAAGLGAEPERRGAVGAGAEQPIGAVSAKLRARESTSEDVTVGETALLHQPPRDLSAVHPVRDASGRRLDEVSRG